MTPKEALQLFKDHKYMTDFSWQDEMSEAAIDALEKAEKYAWHDLRKNPEDLPDKNGRFYVTRFDYVTNTIFYDILWWEHGVWWNRQYTADFTVIAWRYIEPFEEDNE